MSTGSNEISQEKKDFISNVAQAIKSKLSFMIPGYGSKKSQNVFSYLVAPEKYNVNGYTCQKQLAQRMKHEFGGCQITSVSELIKLIQEIGYCDWPGYWEKTANSEEFLHFNDETKEIYQKYVESLRCFWTCFLFNARKNDSMSEERVRLAVGNGISDKDHPLRKDYQVTVDGIIKSVDDIICVMALIYQNQTYLYFPPNVFIDYIASNLTVREIFGQVTLEQLKKILAIQKEIIRNLSKLDGIFKFEFGYVSNKQLFMIINRILEQSNNVEIVQEIMQWIKLFKDENPEFIYNALPCSTSGWLKHFATDNVQLKLNDVCDLLALYFETEEKLDPDVVVELLDHVLICCSDDICKNNSRLDLDFILNIKNVETLNFCGYNSFSTIFRLLNGNRNKISFSDDFIKKLFNSRLDMKYGDISLEKWIYRKAYYLVNSENDEEKKERLTALKMTIDFMLRNSLTKDTKEAGDRFVRSIAQIINDSGREREKDKLVVDFVFKVLRDSKMVNRGKLFVDTLVPELRPEMTSIDHEPEQKNSNIDQTKSNLDLYEESKIGNDNIETDLAIDVNINSENPHVVVNQNEKDGSHKGDDNSKSESSADKLSMREKSEINSIETDINHDADIDLNSENPHIVVNQNEKEDNQENVYADSKLNISSNKNEAIDNNVYYYEEDKTNNYGNKQITEEVENDIIKSNYKTQEQLLRLDTKKINLDDQFKHSVHWFCLSPIVFKLISFASLIVALLSLISLLPQFAPIFAPVLESLTAKLILLCIAFSITLVAWNLSTRTLKSKIPYDNQDKNKIISKNRLEKLYIFDESRKIIPILDKNEKRISRQN